MTSETLHIDLAGEKNIQAQAEIIKLRAENEHLRRRLKFSESREADLRAFLTHGRLVPTGWEDAVHLARNVSDGSVPSIKEAKILANSVLCVDGILMADAAKGPIRKEPCT